MNKFIYVVCVLAAFSYSWSCNASSGLGSESHYAALLKSSGPGHMWLAPDKQWLVLGEAKLYQTQQWLNPQLYFEAVGKTLNREAPLEKDTPEFAALELLHLQTRALHRLSLPDHQFVSVHWSPDSSQLALVARQADKLSLWHYQITTGHLRLWSEVSVSAQFGSETLVWLPDSSAVIVRQSLIKASVSESKVQPIVLKKGEYEAQSRIYPDALDSEPKRQLFRQLTWQQAVLVQSDGQFTPLAQPSMLEQLSLSPDGHYLLLQWLDEDLHAAMKFNRLARRYQVVELASNKIVAEPAGLAAADLVARQPDAAAKGNRLLQWLPGESASLVWVEAMERQGHKVEAAVRDQVWRWAAPFQQQPQLLFQTSWRLFQLAWTLQGRAIYSDFHAGSKQLRNWSWQAGATVSVLLHQYDYSNALTSVGELVTVRQPTGVTYALADQQDAVYFSAASPNRYGEFAVVTRHGSKQGEQTQVFSADKKRHLRPLYVRMQDNNVFLLLTSNRPDRAPSLFGWADGKLSDQALYDWQTKTRPLLPEAQQLQYRREDGVELSSLLYLPAAQTRKKHPVLIWLYPRAYFTHQQQQRVVPERGYSPMQPMAADFALLEGFAVLDASNAPIVATQQQQPNDNFIQQQQLNAAAMVTALEKTGLIDTNQMYLLGHSYGAFSALSLLATTDYFQGAIARSGAYNRSLTPLGFQSEKRSLWQATDLYLQLSPFFQADKINAPVLLIHGTEDQNAGTPVLQSDMMFQALQALGKDVELLLLPGEGHQYQGQDNLLQMLQHQASWLKRQHQQKAVVEN